MLPIRINKYLSQNGYASRREIDTLIKNGDIKINNNLALAGEKITEKDVIHIRGVLFKPKQIKKNIYILLNKPRGILSAAKDDRNRKTVIDLINTTERLYPIGRLDYDTEGAIILTNDGEIFNKIIHPKHEIYKEYFAIIKGEFTDKNLLKLSNGVKLEDGMTLPAKIKILKRSREKSEVLISIREGRNRQIRRMFDFVKNPVIFLRRESIGKIKLDDLKVGKYRELTKEEIKYIETL